MGTKKCPRCAEMVQGEASVCRYCGFKFNYLTPKNGIMAGFVIVALVMLAPRCSPARDNQADAAPAIGTPLGNGVEAVEARTVTIPELYNAYDANEARAQREYGDQVLAVSGIVRSVDLDFADEPVVTLTDGTHEINTYFDEVAGAATADLVKGEKAVIACKSVREVMARPSLHDCYVGDADTIRQLD